MLQSMGSQRVRHDSATEQGQGFFFLQHHTTCGTLVPRPGIESSPSAVSAESKPLVCQGIPRTSVLLMSVFPLAWNTWASVKVRGSDGWPRRKASFQARAQLNSVKTIYQTPDIFRARGGMGQTWGSPAPSPGSSLRLSILPSEERVKSVPEGCLRNLRKPSKE